MRHCSNCMYCPICSRRLRLHPVGPKPLIRIGANRRHRNILTASGRTRKPVPLSRCARCTTFLEEPFPLLRVPSSEDGGRNHVIICEAASVDEPRRLRPYDGSRIAAFCTLFLCPSCLCLEGAVCSARTCGRGCDPRRANKVAAVCASGAKQLLRLARFEPKFLSRPLVFNLMRIG
jgi:hypothetical protein